MSLIDRLAYQCVKISAISTISKVLLATAPPTPLKRPPEDLGSPLTRSTRHAHVVSMLNNVIAVRQIVLKTVIAPHDSGLNYMIGCSIT
ncbi:hypothetical protein [Actinoallomurus sp. NPDC052274]|uniref:hypothetical protein n=1 Tax=Actinoallomurus sp. NPDC052274 TaxID=3155420 RepID=UPI00341C6E69